MCAAVRANLIGSVNWDIGWEYLCHSAWVATYPASGQLSTCWPCQPGRLTQRQKLPWRRRCWIPWAFQWWIWKTSQIVHLLWHNILYFREWGFQGRQWEQSHPFTGGGRHSFLLSGTSACLVMLCPRCCSCWWMCVVRKCPLGTPAPLGWVLWLVPSPAGSCKGSHLGWVGRAKKDAEVCMQQGQRSFGVLILLTNL